MVAAGGWAVDPPETNSAGFWLGPGAASMAAAAAQLGSIAGAIMGMLGGHEAVATALQTSWPDPTGSAAVLSNVPNLLWQAQAATHLTASSALIAQTATAFETLKMATPTPVEIAETQAEHAALQSSNFLGLLTPLITANRARYSEQWLTAAANKYAYAAASASGVQAIPPMPPPTPTATPVNAPSAAVGAPADKSAAAPAAADPMAAMMPALSQIGSMGGSLGQLGSGGGLASLPQEFLSPLMSMFSGANGMGGADSLEPLAAGWLSAPIGGGGPVAANLLSAAGSGGGFGGAAAGGGGFGGAGGIGGLGSAALRGPAAWASSTVTSAAPAEGGASVSRLAEARAAGLGPGSSAGLGSSGAMMGPMMAGAHNEQDKDKAAKGVRAAGDPLTAVATLYRAPTGIPVITGTGGTRFHSGGGGGAQPT